MADIKKYQKIDLVLEDLSKDTTNVQRKIVALANLGCEVRALDESYATLLGKLTGMQASYRQKMKDAEQAEADARLKKKK